MKTTLLKRKLAVILFLAFSSTALLTSCAKNDPVPLEEDINAEIPEMSITVSKDGNKSTATITGKIDSFWFDENSYNEDGSISSNNIGTRTRYEIKYDKIKIISNGSQTFEFSRIAPYTYNIIHIAEDKNEKVRIKLERRTQQNVGYQSIEKEY